MLKQQIQLKNSHSLVLSPQMKQSLSILKMNAIELCEYIMSTAEKNPFLEYDAPESNNNATNNISLQYRHNNRNVNPDYDPLANACSNKSLSSILQEQIASSLQTPTDIIIANYMIILLDEDGYIRESISNIASHLRCSEQQITAVLRTLQTFEPSGIFSTSLQECITTQLEDIGLLDAETLKVLTNIDHDFSWRKIQNKLKFSDNQMKRIISNIRRTNPRPISCMQNVDANIRIIDAAIKVDVRNNIIAELNTQHTPYVAANDQYFHQILPRVTSQEEKKYCMQQWQDALFITKAISQRNDTILKVLDCIIEMQKDYFLHGIQYLKPMTLSNISKKTNLHESTISRINNKIVETPFGIHEIKFFFSGGIDSNLFEESISSTSIKLQIKQMIDAETIALSDDDITNALKQQGIDISRRTVAKYRISMNIPSSHSRRSYDNYRK